jgi:hypothetical protein
MTDRELLKKSLDALETKGEHHPRVYQAIAALRERLAQPEQEPVAWLYRDAWGVMKLSQTTPPPVGAFPVYSTPPQRKPLTDDHGKALLPQYQVIEQQGRWQLIYDQHQIGNTVQHEFRILKLRHDISIYPGISLIEAKKWFRERVESDNE